MKKFLVVVCLIFIAVVASCFFLDRLRTTQEETIAALKSKIVSMKFSVTKVETGMVIDYSLVDLMGNEVYSGNTALRGKDLFIDCIVKELDSETKLCFPVSFYSDVVPLSEGTVIVNTYNVEGFPEIFRGLNSSESKKVKKLYSEVLTQAADHKAFRSSPHITVKGEKTSYQLVARIKGGIEILQE